MPAYSVVFHMPSWIAKGIKSGTMEAVGGVIRETEGKKPVVMWLRPALDTGKAAAAVAPRLPFLAGGAALATAATVAGSAITVVAFALLSKQISRVEARLEDALAKLDAIKADTGWLKRQLVLNHRAKLAAALFAADTMEATGNFDDLTGPLETFHAAQAFYRQQMGDILADECPLALAPAFAEFANLYVLATGAKARALTLLRGEADTAGEIASDAASYASLRERLLAPLENPEKNLGQLVLLTDDAEAAMMESLPFVPAAAAAEYMPLAGLRRDRDTLAEMRDASTAKPGDPGGAVVVNAMAPPGWQPGWTDVVAGP